MVCSGVADAVTVALRSETDGAADLATLLFTGSFGDAVCAMAAAGLARAAEALIVEEAIGTICFGAVVATRGAASATSDFVAAVSWAFGAIAVFSAATWLADLGAMTAGTEAAISVFAVAAAGEVFGSAAFATVV